MRTVMPLRYRDVLQVGLLLLCVPAQYLLSYNTPGERVTVSNILATDLRYIRESLISPQSWTAAWMNSVAWFMKGMVPSLPLNINYGTVSEDESPAYEVLRFRQERGYFAMSLTPREKRPPHVIFRVGQVIKHRAEGYMGVIIGWDVRAKASENWLIREYGDLQALRNWPHYVVLVDERDPIATASISGEATYVVQQELELMRNTEVQHELLENFFVAYDGAQYIAQEWLRKLYPKD